MAGESKISSAGKPVRNNGAVLYPTRPTGSSSGIASRTESGNNVCMTKIAYLDCGSGISGDMTLGALVDAGVPLDALNAAIGSLGLPGCRLRAQEVRKNGFRATQVTVDYEHEHKHRHLSHITAMIDAVSSARVKRRSRNASSRGWPRPRRRSTARRSRRSIFHEVGAADSIADIVGAAVGFDLLGVERVMASPVPTGTGKIRIAHGECSVPAPGHGRAADEPKYPDSRVDCAGRNDHADWGSHLGHPGRAVWPAARHEDRPHRLRGWAERFSGPPEPPAVADWRNGGCRGRYAGAGLRLGDQSGRHQRRADRLLHHAALGLGRVGTSTRRRSR